MNELIPYSDLEKMSLVMGKTKMFGKSPEELLPLMLIAQAEGKHPAIAAQEYDIIQGRPAINSKSALARFQSAGGSISWVTRTDQKASATLSHPQGGSLTVEWTMQRAAQAGLTGKDNWKKYPAQMLSARVVAEGVRAVFPACLSGMYTVEEVEDFEPRSPKNVTQIRTRPLDLSSTVQSDSEPVATVEDAYTETAPESPADDILDEAAALFDGVFNPDKKALIDLRAKYDNELQSPGKAWIDKVIATDDPNTKWLEIVDKVKAGLRERGVNV